MCLPGVQNEVPEASRGLLGARWPKAAAKAGPKPSLGWGSLGASRGRLGGLRAPSWASQRLPGPPGALRACVRLF